MSTPKFWKGEEADDPNGLYRLSHYEWPDGRRTTTDAELQRAQWPAATCSSCKRRWSSIMPDFAPLLDDQKCAYCDFAEDGEDARGSEQDDNHVWIENHDPFRL